MPDSTNPSGDDQVLSDVKNPNDVAPDATSRPIVPNQAPSQPDPMLNTNPSDSSSSPVQSTDSPQPVTSSDSTSIPVNTSSAPVSLPDAAEPAETPSLSEDDQVVTAEAQAQPTVAPTPQVNPANTAPAASTTPVHEHKPKTLLVFILVVVVLLIIVGLIFVAKSKSGSY